MTDIYLPVNLRQARSSFKYIDSTGVTRGAYTGVPQTTNYGGDRIGASIDFTQMGGKSSTELSYRAQLQAFMMALRGKTNRVYLTDSSYIRRGSFPAVEILSNVDFSSTASWLSDSKYSLSASDGILRSTVLTSGATGYPAYQVPGYTQFVPYVMRSIIRAGRGSFVSLSSLVDNTTVLSIPSTLGYSAGSAVVQTTGLHAGIFDGATTGLTAGDFIEVLFASASRCIQVDGFANLLLRSDEIDNAAWTSVGLGSVTANALAAPDGTVTAELLVQDTSSGGHYRRQNVTVASAAADYALSCCFHSANRGWAFMLMEEQTGGQSAYAFFNLGAGTVGTVTSSTNMASARAFIVAKGNGWFECHFVARKTNAATVIQARLCASTADNTLTYTGSAEGSIYAWRANMAQSSVPTRSVQTTSAAVAASTQQSSNLYVKGLPVSTSGLLLIGDWVEIDGQLKMILASLNSDAAGLGYLQFSPPLRRAVADNTPIIVHKPTGRFMFGGDSSGWSNEPGVFSTASIDLEEAFG